MIRRRLLVALAGLSLAIGSVPAAETKRLREHVAHLASPEMEGRLTGTEGARKAADYIAAQLQEIGAQPLPGQDDFRLPFEFTAGMSDGGTTLTLEEDERGKPRRWASRQLVQGLSFSDNVSVSGPVVFAGYGLTLPQGQDFAYDSYHGLDVKDKIVVVLRYFPEDVDPETRSLLARYSGLRYKALNARELGARALLVVTGPRSPGAGRTVPMTFDTALSGSGIAAASIGAKLTRALFKHAGRDDLETIQRALDTGNPHVTGFDIPGITLTLDVKIDRQRKQAYNVVGYLPAAGEAVSGAQEYVILGAHYDHLGHGSNNDSLAREGEAGQVHHGADDNASGVAAVLEAGRRLAGSALARPVTLAFWTGEELGLLGSSSFIGAAHLGVEHVRAYLNFDMVGRLEDNRLNLQSAGSSSVWPGLVERTNVVAGLDINMQEDPYLPTDSSAFYQAGVPALSFFTGSHANYHRPTDTADTLNYEGLLQIAEFATSLTRKLIRLDERPDFKTVARNQQAGGDRDSLRAFTGTIPDYTTEVAGLQLSGVVEDGPAHKAGLRGGDVIVEFGGRTIANVYDYTYALDAVKIGQPVKVVFLRDGVRAEVEITPTSRR